MRISAGEGSSLRLCDDCGVARWCEACADDGLKEHLADRDEGGRPQCEVLAESAADQSINLIYHGDPHRPGPLLITQPEHCLRKPAPLPDTWDDYLSSWSCDAPPPFERTMTTLSLSPPLTVIAGLERFGLLERFDTSASAPLVDLEIHLIGAELEFELVMAGPTWEQLLHRLPSVKRLRLVLVGPNIKASDQGTVDHECCPKCIRAGRTRTVVLHQVRSLARAQAHAAGHLPLGLRRRLDDGADARHRLQQRLSRGAAQLAADDRAPARAAHPFRLHQPAGDGGAGRRSADPLDRRRSRPVGRGANRFREEHAHVDPFSPHVVWRRNSHWLGFR